MKKKTSRRRLAKRRKLRRERDLAVLAELGVVVVESPSPGYVHPLVRALARIIRAWRLRYRMRQTSVARRANLSREALRKLEKGDVWYSTNVAVRVCNAMGLDWLEANAEAVCRVEGGQAKKCQL